MESGRSPPQKDHFSGTLLLSPRIPGKWPLFAFRNGVKPRSAEQATSRASDNSALRVGARACQASPADRIGGSSQRARQSSESKTTQDGTGSAGGMDHAKWSEKAWSPWGGSLVPAVRAVAAKYPGGRELVAILSVTTRGRADLVLRIEQEGELLTVMGSFHRDRVPHVEVGRKWACKLVADWMADHEPDAAKAALLSPEELAFWADDFRRAMACAGLPGCASAKRRHSRRRFLVNTEITQSPLILRDLRRGGPPLSSENWPRGTGGSIGERVEPVNPAISMSTIHDIYCMMLSVVG